MEILGQKEKLLEALGHLEDVPRIRSQIKKLTNNTGSGVALRILERKFGGTREFAIAKDPLGDVVDVANAHSYKTEERISQIVQQGYFGLLAQALSIPPQTRGIFIWGAKNSMLIVDRGEIAFRKAEVTRLVQELLLTLAIGECAKSHLTWALWSHKYQPLRHDPLIYNLVSRARTLLGNMAHWIVTTENGYRMAEQIKVESDVDLFYRPEGARAKGAASDRGPSPDGLPAKMPVPNFRQLDIVNGKGAISFLDVQTCVQRFQVSRVTAMRDLKRLCELGLLQRVEVPCPKTSLTT